MKKIKNNSNVTDTLLHFLLYNNENKKASNKLSHMDKVLFWLRKIFILLLYINGILIALTFIIETINIIIIIH